MPKTQLLKTLWRKGPDQRWSIHGIKGIELEPKPGFESDFYPIQSRMEMLTSTPGTANVHDFFASFGTTDFLLKQSILPVVALVKGERDARCIGTGFFVSCSGWLVTACHVLLDPQDRNYGRVSRDGHILRFMDDLMMGTVVPLSPAYAGRGLRFHPFSECRYWGTWTESPLVHEPDRFEILTDVALCKVGEPPDGAAHQPLTLSLNAFAKGETAFAIGYAEMSDIPMERRNASIFIQEFEPDLYVSVGEVANLYTKNHLSKEVPTPGPCFDFRARIPGKMSGGPIFGGDGAVVRGVVSRSFSGEKHAFGAMLGPTMSIPLVGTETLKDMMDSGLHGIARIQGTGL